MGKAGEEQPLPTNVSAQNTQQNAAENRFRVSRFIRFRCVFALLLGVSVLLSTVFWLPPFFRHGDQGDLDLNSRFRDHYIVATFNVKKPVSVLEDNMLQLRDDIFDEIGVPTTKVEIISLKSLAGSNITKVIFGFDPDVKGSRMSSAAKSLIRASFVSLIINQSSLRLTASLFGDPFSFDVLKFVGGITVSPPQRAFLLQKVQILFNFTLNFSIDEIQENFNKLTSQLKSGLNLAPYENLYISLTNSKGSTVVPPTTVQSSVLLAVGNTPSMGRLKQLAQTITGSPTKNLGLNNTEFGRVKQVSLSSILQHSLHGGDGSGTSSPSPAPLPHPNHHHRHHHRHHDVHLAPATSPAPSTVKGGSTNHHHHHHHHDVHLAPATSPAPATVEGGSTTKKSSPASAPVPAPMPEKSHKAKPPGCQYGHRNRFPQKGNKHSHFIPPVASPVPAKYVAPSPQQHVNPPAPVPRLIPASSPLPHVVYSHTNPPPKRVFDAEPPDLTPLVSPLQSSSSAGFFPSHKWILLFLVLVLDL